MLSAKDLFRYRQGLDKVIPQRGGDKDFLPDGSWLQEKKLESFNAERQQVLSEPRVQRQGDLVKGEWNSERRLVEFKKEMRNFWEHMGFIDSARKWLYPEEALFLMETNILEVWCDDLPLSISEGYMLFLDKSITLEYYQVFAHLRRIGYVVVRHQGRLESTKYEHQIGLDKALSRRERKLLQRKQRLELKSKKSSTDIDKDSTTKSLDADASDNKVDNVEYMEVDGASPDNGNDSSEPDVVIEGVNDKNKMDTEDGTINNKQSEQVEDNIVGVTVTGKSGFDKIEDKQELNPCNAEVGGSEETRSTKTCIEDMSENRLEDTGNMQNEILDVKSQLCFQSTYVKPSSTREYSLASEKASHDKPAVNPSIVNSADDPDTTKSVSTEAVNRWNFDEIIFPDFGCNKSVIVVAQPNIDQTPGQFETKFTSYEFDWTQCINKKKEKRKNRKEEAERTDNLRFSNAMMNKELNESLKSCTNWKEYKLEKTRHRALWKRKKAFPHLFGEVEPLVKPELAASTSSVLEQLVIIKADPTESNRNLEKPEVLPDFDVYKPDVKFRKSSPGIPDHRVVVARCSDPMPELSTIRSITRYLGDEVPLNWAVVESGNIAFYTISDFTLPLDISIG